MKDFSTPEVDLIKKVSLFRGLDTEALSSIVEDARQRSVSHDAFYFYEGDTATSPYVFEPKTLRVSDYEIRFIPRLKPWAFSEFFCKRHSASCPLGVRRVTECGWITHASGNKGIALAAKSRYGTPEASPPRRCGWNLGKIIAQAAQTTGVAAIPAQAGIQSHNGFPIKALGNNCKTEETPYWFAIRCTEIWREVFNDRIPICDRPGHLYRFRSDDFFYPTVHGHPVANGKKRAVRIHNPVRRSH